MESKSAILKFVQREVLRHIVATLSLVCRSLVARLLHAYCHGHVCHRTHQGMKQVALVVRAMVLFSDFV